LNCNKKIAPQKEKKCWLFRFLETIFENAIDNYGVSRANPINSRWATIVMTMSSLAGYPNGFTISALIYQSFP
jgi:hypothetical protein